MGTEEQSEGAAATTKRKKKVCSLHHGCHAQFVFAVSSLLRL